MTLVWWCLLCHPDHRRWYSDGSDWRQQTYLLLINSSSASGASKRMCTSNNCHDSPNLSTVTHMTVTTTLLLDDTGVLARKHSAHQSGPHYYRRSALLSPWELTAPQPQITNSDDCHRARPCCARQWLKRPGQAGNFLNWCERSPWNAVWYCFIFYFRLSLSFFFWYLTYISHTAHVIAIDWTSVGLLSVTSCYCVETAQPIVKLSSLPRSPVILVFWGPNFFPEFQWEHPNWGDKCKGVEKSCNFRPISRYSS